MLMIESVFDAVRNCWTPRTVGWGVRLRPAVVTLPEGELTERHHSAAQSITYDRGQATIYPRMPGARTGRALWSLYRGSLGNQVAEIRRLGGKGGSRLILLVAPHYLQILPDLFRPLEGAERRGEDVLADISRATGIAVAELEAQILSRGGARAEFWAAVQDRLIDAGLIEGDSVPSRGVIR